MQVVGQTGGAFLFLETAKERAALKVILNYWLLKEAAANTGKPRSASFECAETMLKGLE